MGVKIGSLIPAREVELDDLAGRVIGIDGYNTVYQFLARIRRKFTGEPLRDKKGRVTSHLSGILYRVSNFVEAGIKPVFVWDGMPPRFKKWTIRARRAVREEAMKRWIKALEKGEEGMVYAQASSKLTPKMVEESIQLLDYMGVPSVRAPSEGEAQLAMMAMEGDIWAGASQDWDSLLFGSPRLARNLSITGRRRLPRKDVYVEVKPEVIELERTLNNLGITREQLITIGILIGTDYNPSVKGVGPKTALRLVKEYKTLDRVLANIKWEGDVNIEEVFNFFLTPPATKAYEIKWKEPKADGVIGFLCGEHNFSEERVRKALGKISAGYERMEEKATLEKWFKQK